MKNLTLQLNGDLNDIITSLNSFNKQGFKVKVIFISVGISSICVFNLKAGSPTLRTKLDNMYLTTITKEEGVLV